MSRPLRKPAFWGASIIVFLLGLVSWGYWVAPGSIEALPNKEAENDSSPAMPKPLLAPNQGTEETKTKELYENFLAQKQVSSPQLQLSPIKPTRKPAAPPPEKIVETPLLVEAKNLLRAEELNKKGKSWEVNPYTQSSSQPFAGTPFGSSSGANPYTQSSSEPLTGQTGSSLGIQSPASPTNQNPSVVPISPVQPALDQPPVANPAVTPTEPQDQTNTLKQPLQTTALPSQTSPSTNMPNAGAGYNPPAVTKATPAPNSYTNSYQPQQLPTAASYSAPVTPTNIAPYSNQVPNQATKSYTNPRLNSSFQNSGGLQPSQAQQPNSKTPIRLPEP